MTQPRGLGRAALTYGGAEMGARAAWFAVVLALGCVLPQRDFGAWSLLLALVGLVAGALVTIGPYSYLAANGIDLSEVYAQSGTVEVAGVGFDMTLNIGIFPENVAIIAGFVVFATLAAGLYPAWKAGRVSPVETIKLV